MTEFYRKLDRTQTIALSRESDARDRAVRLYQTASAPPHAEHRWALQIRTPVTLANGQDGTKDIAAHADLGVADLRALRDAIEAELARAEARDAYYADGREFSVLDEEAPR